MRKGKGERRERLQLLSTIYEDQLVGIRRAKNESSSTRRGLRVGTENMKFLRGFKQGVLEIKGFRFRKCPRDFLKFLLRSKGRDSSYLCLFFALRAVWQNFWAVGMLPYFGPMKHV